MTLLVQKYGGSSVANIERIQNVARRIQKHHNEGHQMVVVLSAMSGETDRLLELAHAITKRPNPREMDALVSTGEQVSISLLSIALEAMGIKAKSYNGDQARILTDQAHTKARIKNIDTSAIEADLAAGYVVVVAGFQGVTEDGSVTTLGRGGSDTTAVALAASLNATECQIFTDVDGVYTTDPRIEPKAKKLDKIAFEEMLELSSLGSKVLQIRSVELAAKNKVPIRVLSSLVEGGEGTLITTEKDIDMEAAIISGVATSKNEAKITVLGVPDQPGIAFNILEQISDANIEVDMIVQNISQDGTTDFTFTINEVDFDKALEITENSAREMGARKVLGDKDIVKVSLVGLGMRSHAGVASLMFKTLANEKINIKMISTSEIKVSVVIDSKYHELAVRALHEAFKLDE
ncbi:aspartate kinase [Ignatzschineria cameli]|uniref:Aspartokinase n=1 Tax=Ignatzschineria cameli TaxID=2182793 RepID=A0A2U2AL43_9GAMM|nr:aspartate kinase [Ignatzschineria cameli]PWD83799.1 aspartate kinase [Ignatzschineria cameli]PWD86123.1 aspartate kinase [Ignatzschineria cameli]PWD88313.1 aspartate kinase [Ignatzschineria cameli]PWD88702.1 aspartate kinase [Ignatzschineria cameli]PWD89228.1 aspartate kinase [Ignatzschineria cameli]